MLNLFSKIAKKNLQDFYNYNTFVLSIKYPEIRMTLAYTGQLLNFCASIIMFTYIDRVFFKALDVGNEINCAARIITGKLIGQMILVAGVVVTYYVLKV